MCVCIHITYLPHKAVAEVSKSENITDNLWHVIGCKAFQSQIEKCLDSDLLPG